MNENQPNIQVPLQQRVNQIQLRINSQRQNSVDNNDMALQEPHPGIAQQLRLDNLQNRQLLNARPLTAVIPIIPISSYKYYIEICMFLGCLFALTFMNYNMIHLLWGIWYVTVGFKRHRPELPKVRFWGQFFNMIIWIMTNWYVFSGKSSNSVFPVLILLLNMDYYCIGSGLCLTFSCFILFFIVTWVSDFRLRRISRKLNKRRKQIVKQQLAKFISNQQSQAHDKANTLRQLSQTSASSKKQGQSNIQSCSICLQDLKSQKNFDKVNQGQKVLKLFCSHRFHYHCINEWIEVGNNTCPVCRGEMF